MNILKNFSEIMKLNVKAFGSKENESIKDIDKYLSDFEKDLKAIKAEGNAIEAEINRIKKNLDEIEEENQKYDKYIDKARDSGNVSDVNIFTSKKEKLENEYIRLQEIYNINKDKMAKIIQMEKKLSLDIEILRGRISKVDSSVDPKSINDVLEKANRLVLETEALDDLNNRIDNDSSFNEFINKND